MAYAVEARDRVSVSVAVEPARSSWLRVLVAVVTLLLGSPGRPQVQPELPVPGLHLNAGTLIGPARSARRLNGRAAALWNVQLSRGLASQLPFQLCRSA